MAAIVATMVVIMVNMAVTGTFLVEGTVDHTMDLIIQRVLMVHTKDITGVIIPVHMVIMVLMVQDIQTSTTGGMAGKGLAVAVILIDGHIK